MEAPRVRPLPALTQNQLRSAVVVFQPAQAIHEVIANAIDAGASRVDIVFDFDRLCFTVSDNGSGMTLADLALVGQRHVTSKWSDHKQRTQRGNSASKAAQCAHTRGSSSALSSDTVDDLAGSASARTIGWRGEALSSLAQLCVLEAQTRPRAREAAAANELSSTPSEPNSKRRKVDQLQHIAASAFAALSSAAAAASSSAAASSAGSIATAAPSATYSKLIRHGVEEFCGYAPEHRASAGCTLSLSELYASMPVRAKMMQEDKSKGKERERLKRKIMRLALVHPQVEFALYDATGAAQRVNQPAAATTSRHYFPDSAASRSIASSTTHLPIVLSQRIWHKPRTASLLANFQSIFGSASTLTAAASLASSEHLSPRFFSLESNDFASSLVEMRPQFAPKTPEATTPATSAFLARMRVSGFLSHPARVQLLHKDLQFIYVNRHFIVHKPLNKLVEGMYERLAKLIPADNTGAVASAEGAEQDKHAKSKRPTGNALQRGSIKHKKGDDPSPAKQGRRRHPAFLLAIELPASAYDLLFDPDKTSIQFTQTWAVNEGITQALRKWLFTLYPALQCLDKQIFPPTYMPLWLDRRKKGDGGSDDDEAADETMAAAAPSAAHPGSAAMLASNSWAAMMSASPSEPVRVPPLIEERKEPEADHTPTAASSRSASSFRRQIATTPPAAAAVASMSSSRAGALASSAQSTAVPASLQPSRLTYGAPAAAAAPISHAHAPSFHSSFGHVSAAALARSSRAPSTFLAAGRSSAAAPVSAPVSAPSAVAAPIRTSSRSHPSSAASAKPRLSHHLPAALPLSWRHRSREDSASCHVRDIALSAFTRAEAAAAAEAEAEERDREWSIAQAKEQQHDGDGAAEWTGGEVEEDAAAMRALEAAPPVVTSESKFIRESAPSKERTVVEPDQDLIEDDSGPPQSEHDPAAFADFVSPPSGLDWSARSPVKVRPLGGAPNSGQSQRSPAVIPAAASSERRSAGSFTRAAPRTPPRALASAAVPASATAADMEAHRFSVTVEEPPVSSAAASCPCSHPDHLAVEPLTFASIPLSPEQQQAANASDLVPPAASSRYLSPPRVPRGSSPSNPPSPSPPPISSAWLPQHASPGTQAPSAATSSEFHPIQLAREMLQRCEVVGQLDSKFIVVRVDGLLLCVDQHAADERRRLEFLQSHLDRYVEQLPLIQAMVLPISAAEEMVLRTHEAEMGAWGFKVRFAQAPAVPKGSPAAGSAAHRASALVSSRVHLLSVPLICGVELDVDDFREYMQQLRDTRPIKPAAASAASGGLGVFRQRTPLPVQRILNYKSCRSSVMFGDALTPATMRSIIAGLMRCQFPYNCAHGRPTMTPIVHVTSLHKQGMSASTAPTQFESPSKKRNNSAKPQANSAAADAASHDSLWSAEARSELLDMFAAAQ